ncbi:MAG TPA: hypothetical protein VNO20_05730 [Solirubrobacterales bacterium]|nr:hypothetical protein [Solirubrobacterales bacterium]
MSIVIPHRLTRALLALCVPLLLAIGSPASAQAAFGFSDLEVTLTDPGDAPVTQAGSHPYAFTTDFDLNTIPSPDDPPDPTRLTIPEGELKDLSAELPVGLIGDPSAVPTCPYATFVAGSESGSGKQCPASSIVGISKITTGTGVSPYTQEIYNLAPASGQAARFGFIPVGILPVSIIATVSPEPPYRIIATVENVSQASFVYSSRVTIWGNPADPAHDAERGGPAGVPEKAFLTMPRSCPGEPLEFPFSIASWADPDTWVDQSTTAPATTGCETLGFDPDVGATPTTPNAASPSGFEFSIDVDDPGLADPDSSAESDLKKAVVTLPEGLTVNPASADGLGACSEAQLAAETPSSDFGSGCPASSKVASVQVETPLLPNDPLSGSVFLATPYDNPFDTLLAGYLVIKSPERGVAVKLAGKIEPDPVTGQLTASFDQNPQFPFSHLEVSFKIGNRAPLITPSTCGTYDVKSELYPWSGNPPLVKTDSFTIDHGPDGGACVAGDPSKAGNPADVAALPFAPPFDAGTVSPIAAAFSPLVVKTSRPDGSQALKGLTLDLPQGLTGKLAGVATCSDAALAAAAANGGRAEQSAPSCPAQSRLGTVIVGAGAGPTPYHAQGTAYLAAPYKGAPISVAVITPAVAGPFDLGTVVVRSAAQVDPKTTEITVASDPFPEILQGIPLQVRSVHVDADRPGFTLNPTSCNPMSFDGTIFGSPTAASVSSRFQLAECTRLGFKPKLALKLKGGTKRGGHPALTATLTPRAGDANLAAISVALPRSEFLDQAHIGTVCTRVQFAADACPAASVYGKATVTTPLLDYPLSGNVYLRSSDNTLPDLVPDLRGPAYQPLRVEAAGRTDSIRGGIRNTFDFVPDAPFTKLVLQLPGGRKGLLINSRDICKGTNRATVKAAAHNGDRITLRPKLQVKCGKQSRKKRRGPRAAR